MDYYDENPLKVNNLMKILKRRRRRERKLKRAAKAAKKLALAEAELQKQIENTQNSAMLC